MCSCCVATATVMPTNYLSISHYSGGITVHMALFKTSSLAHLFLWQRQLQDLGPLNM